LSTLAGAGINAQLQRDAALWPHLHATIAASPSSPGGSETNLTSSPAPAILAVKFQDDVTYMQAARSAGPVLLD